MGDVVEVRKAFIVRQRQGREVPGHLMSGSRPLNRRRRATARSAQAIEPIEIQEEMESSFLDYAMSVITTAPSPARATASSRCTGGSSTACTTSGAAPTGRT